MTTPKSEVKMTMVPLADVGHAQSACDQRHVQTEDERMEHDENADVTACRFTLHELFHANFIAALSDDDIRDLMAITLDQADALTHFDNKIKKCVLEYSVTTDGHYIAEIGQFGPVYWFSEPPEDQKYQRLRVKRGYEFEPEVVIKRLAVAPRVAPRPAPAPAPAPAVAPNPFMGGGCGDSEPEPEPEPAPVPASESVPPAPATEDVEESWEEVKPVRNHDREPQHPIFGSDAFEWCRTRTGHNFKALNERHKQWWSVKMPNRMMYCGIHAPMVRHTSEHGEFKYFINNLPSGPLSPHDIREMVSAVIPVMDVYRPMYRDQTGEMQFGSYFSVTVPAQYNGVSAQEALSILQAGPINFRGTAMRIQRFKGY